MPNFTTILGIKTPRPCQFLRFTNDKVASILMVMSVETHIFVITTHFIIYLHTERSKNTKFEIFVNNKLREAESAEEDLRFR